ncbi:MAG: PAS domain S-box protein [Bacteroidota bacterium]
MKGFIDRLNPLRKEISESVSQSEFSRQLLLSRFFLVFASGGLLIFGILYNMMVPENPMDLTWHYIQVAFMLSLLSASFISEGIRKKTSQLTQASLTFMTVYSYYLYFITDLNPYLFLTTVTCILLISAYLPTLRLLNIYLGINLFSILIFCFVLPQHVELLAKFYSGFMYGILIMVTYITARLSLNSKLQLKDRSSELGREKTFFKSVVESSSDLIWAIDAEYKLLTYNTKFEEVFETHYLATAEPGLDLKRIEVPQLSNISWIDHYKRALSGEPVLFSSSFKVGESTTWYEFSLNPIKEEGRIIGIAVFGHNITSSVEHDREKKTMEDEILKTKERYTLAMEGSNDALWDWDLINEEIFLSPRFKEIMGREHYTDTVTPEKWMSWVHPEDYATVLNRFVEHIKGKTDQLNGEFRLRHSDGSYVWVLGKGRASKNEEGHSTRITGSLSDITARKETEGLLEGFLDTTRNGISMFKPLLDEQEEIIDFVWTLINKAGEKFTQLKADQLVGQRMMDVYTDDQTKILFQRMKSVMESGQPFEFEVCYGEDQQGEEVWFNIFIGRTHEGLSLTYIDISKRKKDENQMALLSLVASKTDNGVVITNAKGKVEWVNEGFTKISGYSLEEMIGKKPGIVLQGPKTDKKVIQRISKKLKEQVTFSEEILNYSKEGQPYWVSLHMTPIFDEKGKLLRFIALENDITAQKEHQNALKKAKNEAEAAAVAKSEFLATMSHEIRTPMNAVIGMTGLLLDSTLDNEQREFVETIRISGDNLLTVINDILDFSKIDSGKLELEAQAFDLEETVEDVLDLLGSKAHDKGLELAYDPSDQLPRKIISDPTRISQVMVNLINNAIKFTTEGEVILRSEILEYREGNRCLLQFSVADTGIGIPEEKIGRLFKSFSQVDASTTRKYGGTGLGLAICKKLVHMMKGEIWIESTYGEGSTFFFTVEVELDKTPAEVLKPRNIRGKKALLVDDNKTNLKILEKQLQSWGIESVSVQHPFEAIPTLEQDSSIDFAILDMQMPDQNGIELAKQIRASFKKESLPLIMLTSMGSSLKADEKELFHAFLSKPIRRKLLLRYIIQTFSKNQKAIEELAKNRKGKSSQHETIQNIKILIAEDNVVNQKVATRILAKLGYSADIAANGQEAVDAMGMRFYDLVFMDMQMPEMDGLTATGEIRKNFLHREEYPLIVAMTANALIRDRERCIEAGMDDYISKPVKIDHIRDMMEKWFTVEGKLKMERNKEPEA